MSRHAISYLIYHIFLPPELPHGDDSDPKCEMVLLDTVIEALRKFKSLITDDQHHVIDLVLTMVTSMRTMLDCFRGQGGLAEGKVEVILRRLCEHGE